MENKTGAEVARKMIEFSDENLSRRAQYALRDIEEKDEFMMVMEVEDRAQQVSFNAQDLTQTSAFKMLVSDKLPDSIRAELPNTLQRLNEILFDRLGSDSVVGSVMKSPIGLSEKNGDPIRAKTFKIEGADMLLNEFVQMVKSGEFTDFVGTLTDGLGAIFAEKDRVYPYIMVTITPSSQQSGDEANPYIAFMSRFGHD